MLSRVLQALVLMTAMAAIAPAYAADSAPAQRVMKVVWHVDFADPRRLSAMIRNVNNMVTSYQNDPVDYDVRIVFVAAGIRVLTEDPLARTPSAEDAELKARRSELIRRLEQLRTVQNVKLELCEITRESVDLPKDRIIPGVLPVHSGVVRIADPEHRGYAYLKAE